MPLAPCHYAPEHRAAKRINKLWYTALTRGIREHFQFARIFAPLWGKTNRRILLGVGSVSETCPKISGIFSWIFSILSESSPPLRTPIALTQKLWKYSSYLQRSGSNNWFYVVITILLNTWIFAVQNWWNDGVFCPHLATRQATVNDGCVVLNLLLQLQPVDKSRLPWKHKFGMASEICNRQKMLSLVVVRSFRLHHTNLSIKAIFWWHL